MPEYKVFVGNIGHVYLGTDPAEAMRCYSEYLTLSRGNYGRAAGEPVTLFKDGEPIQEYEGNQQ